MDSELEILRETDHPNIVKLMDMFEDDVNFYIITELMEGGDLFKFIENNKS